MWQIARRLILIIIAIGLLLGMACPLLAQVEGDDDKSSASQIVLCRKLTNREKDLFVNLSREDKISAIKNDILPREQRLVAVRALLAIGEGKHATEILKYLNFNELKTCEELIGYFKQLKSKHASVKEGLEEVYKLSLNEEQVFENAAIRVYNEVFCPQEELKPEDKKQLLDFFKASQATEYSKMLQILIGTMDKEDKEELIKKILREVGRHDLIDNKELNFVGKMVEQENITCKNLRELFKQLK